MASDSDDSENDDEHSGSEWEESSAPEEAPSRFDDKGKGKEENSIDIHKRSSKHAYARLLLR